MNNKTTQILLTNDDSIHSPGLWAAAEALDTLGYVHVVAPRDQHSGAGRSMPIHTSGIIEKMSLTVNKREWNVFAVDGSPGQSMLHGVYDVIKSKPDLVVSGINYGENVGSGVTVSGTIGAAIEAATLGIPALAVSMQTGREHHFSLSQDIDFSAAGYFTHLLANWMLHTKLPEDVDIIKVDVPCDATPDTPISWTRQSRQRYYLPKPIERASLMEPGPVGYDILTDFSRLEPGSDLYALLIEKKVSVSPLSIDLTSRVDLGLLDSMLQD